MSAARMMMALGRGLVIASAFAVVAAGLGPMTARPALLAGLLAVFGGTLVATRWWSGAVTRAVFATAYVSYGLVAWLVGADVADMPFWLAAFAGLAMGGAPWNRWLAAAPWRVPLAWWAVSVAVLWPLAVWRANGLAWTWPLAPDTGPVVTASLLQLSLALWMDRLLAPAAADGRLARAPWTGPLLLSALATGAAALYQHAGDPAWLSREPWIGLQRSAGLMGDANPLGVATALWAPLALWAGLTSVRRGHAVLGGGAALVLAAAAWVSGARTTLIFAAAGLAGLTWAAATPVGGPWRARALGALAGLAVLAGIGLAVAPGVNHASPFARLMSTVPRSSPTAMAYELFWRRDGYGLAAVAAIREHPLLGVGVGRFTALSTRYHQQETGRAIPPDNAQNFWRHTLAEQGLVGTVPILWLTGLTLVALLRRRPGGEERLLRVMVAGLGVALMFGYPVQNPAIAVTVATLVATVARRPGGSASPTEQDGELVG